MRIAFVHDSEYTLRYPFTDQSRLINYLEAEAFDQRNIDELFLRLDKLDAIVVAPNALHNTHIRERIEENIERLLEEIQYGLGYLVMHTSDVEEFVVLRELGIAVEPDYTREKVIVNDGHEAVEGYDVERLYEEYREIAKRKAYVRRYPIFSARAPKHAPVVRLMKDPEGYPRVFELRYGSGRLIAFLSPITRFRIGGDLIKRLVRYVSRSYLSRYIVGENGRKVYVKVDGNSFYGVVREPYRLVSVLEKKLLSMFESKEFSPLIASSKPLTLEVLFPLVAVDRYNVFLHTVFTQLLDEEFVKELIKGLPVTLVTAIRVLGTYELLAEQLDERYGEYAQELLEGVLKSDIPEEFREVADEEYTLVSMIVHKIVERPRFIDRLERKFRLVDPGDYPVDPKIDDPRALGRMILHVILDPSKELKRLFEQELLLRRRPRVRTEEASSEIVDRLRLQYFSLLKELRDTKKELERIRKAIIAVKGRTLSDFGRRLKENREIITFLLSAALGLMKYLGLI